MGKGGLRFGDFPPGAIEVIGRQSQVVLDEAAGKGA